MSESRLETLYLFSIDSIPIGANGPVVTFKIYRVQPRLSAESGIAPLPRISCQLLLAAYIFFVFIFSFQTSIFQSIGMSS